MVIVEELNILVELTNKLIYESNIDMAKNKQVYELTNIQK